MGLKFLNCKKSASGRLSRGDNTAVFRHVGIQPSRRERLTMLVIVGSNRSVYSLMIGDGNGSKMQDFESSVAAIFLMSSIVISIKDENLVKDIVGTSSVTYSAESKRALFLTRRSLCSVSILVVKIHSYNTRSSVSDNFYIKKSNLEIKRKTFSVIGAKLWNEIPTKLRTLPKLIFKRKIRMILFNVLESEDSYEDLESIISKVRKYSQ